MPDAPEVLRFERVTFGYERGAPLFHEVSFGVARGSMVGLLGPNGAGKTSLMRLATGALAPWSGQVMLDGHALAAISRRDIARSIAVVPQELTMPFAFTVRQMVELGRTPHLHPLGWGMLAARDHERVASALDATSTAELADRRYNELSGGERQRVLVAMALAQEPHLLLLDEPTSHLDIKHQLEVLDLVARLNRETGMTVLASLHDLNLAARYFPRLVLFQRGVVADGPPSLALAPELLERVYGVRVRIGIVRGARHLTVVPPGADEAGDGLPLAPRAHVVAGGGTGDLVMRALAEAAIPFSAGALNLGDSDATLAEQLATHVVTAPPFAPIDDDTRVTTVAAMLAAGSVAVCPIPIGPGNVALLVAAREARLLGAQVWLFEPALPPGAIYDPDAIAGHVATRDFAAGAGARSYRALIEAGARVATSLPELLAGLLSVVVH